MHTNYDVRLRCSFGDHIVAVIVSAHNFHDGVTFAEVGGHIAQECRDLVLWMLLDDCVEHCAANVACAAGAMSYEG